VEILALLVAAICAYPASRRQRTIGLLVGTVVVDLLSVGRLAVLHYTLKYYPGSWEAMHGLVAPLVPVVLLGLYFSRWLAWVSAEGPAAGAPGAA
jgi:exosortase/archaeosortase family protein